MTTPSELHGVTKEQWFKFEALRRSSKTNMWGAGRYLDFDFLPIMDSDNYREMKWAWNEEFVAQARKGETHDWNTPIDCQHSDSGHGGGVSKGS